jgi:hypothetical protein
MNQPGSGFVYVFCSIISSLCYYVIHKQLHLSDRFKTIMTDESDWNSWEAVEVSHGKLLCGIRVLLLQSGTFTTMKELFSCVMEFLWAPMIYSLSGNFMYASQWSKRSIAYFYLFYVCVFWLSANQNNDVLTRYFIIKLYILELSNNIQRSSDLFSSKLRGRLLSSISPAFVTFVLVATQNNGARFIMVLYHVLTKYVIRTLYILNRVINIVMSCCYIARSFSCSNIFANVNVWK